MKYSSCLISWLVLLSLPAYGQVVPDRSLATKVTTSDRFNYIIEEGNRQGNNLFHSFESFSVPTNGSVLFNNASDIQHIFSRVTGNSISEIDGLIRSLGEANLFLLNPNGIIFSDNAALDIGGSFIASTGESINFADGTEFSAVSPHNEPLLTLSIPIGLQYGSNPGEIEVVGTGQQIITNTDPLILSPFVRTDAAANLEVAPTKTLALVGGNVTLEGSSLRANEGRIELGGVSSGFVGLEQTISGWKLDYSKAIIERNVELRSLSAIDASGLTSQGIQLTGRNITISDGSIALVQIQNTAPETKIDLTATELIKINGTDSTTLLPSSINLITLERNSANLTITSPNLILEQAGSVNLFQFGIDRGGDLNVNIEKEIIVDGSSPLNNERTSSLSLFNLGNGEGGDVNLKTNKLKVSDGAFVGSVTAFGTGSGGNVNINVTELVEVTGEAPQIDPNRNSFSSSINASTLGKGRGGRLTIDTAQLKVNDGGDINSNTLAEGNAGEVIINATEFIELVSFEDGVFSTIDSGAISNQPELKAALGLPPITSGDGGKVTINTPQLSITGKNAQVKVTTDGTGQAGDLKINADAIFLRDGGQISASTTSGEGGNIDLQVSDLLLLENQSFIAARAENQGNGGNIAIATSLLNLTENSQINANAFEGNGGNIQIDTLGFFPSSNSTIDASSSLGIDGIVQIEQLDTDPTLGLEQLSTEVIDPNRLVVLNCSFDRENSFVVTNRGGLPANAEEVLSGGVTWQDWRIPERRVTVKSLDLIPEQPQTKIVEAQGWKINELGKIVLTSESDRIENSSKFGCVAKS